MIIRAVGSVLRLITQPDHAHLARAIMQHCVQLTERPRRATILRAIAEHDNGWAEEDETPSRDPDSGKVVDFISAPAIVRQRVWPRAVARLADDPWAAALVAQHALTVYERLRVEGAWTSFFAGMEASRDALLRAAGLPLNELLPDYVFVRLGDLISLVVCTGTTEVLRFNQWSVQLAGHRGLVSPDVFGGMAIPIEIRAKEIPNQLFRTDEELGDAWRKAATATVRGEVTSRPSCSL